MKITALDIRQKTFERAFRGVDKDEVDGFLLTLSQQWERMTDENRELRRQLEQAQQDVQRMREVETSLYRTLKTAEDTSTSMVDQAQKEADLKLREAQMEAEQLLSEARQKARSLVEDAYRQADKAVADMQREVQGLGQEHQRIEGVYDALVRDLQQLAGEVQQKAAKAKERPRDAVAAILSRAASVKVVREEPASPATETTMYVPAPAASSSSASIPATAPAVGRGFADERPRAIGFEPNGPQPGAPSHPEISPKEPYENPGVANPGRVYQPEPATVPNAPEPYVPTPTPDVQPVTPPAPEITPQPTPHPGFAAAPAVAAEAEKSFFDEI